MANLAKNFFRTRCWLVALALLSLGNAPTPKPKKAPVPKDTSKPSAAIRSAAPEDWNTDFIILRPERLFSYLDDEYWQCTEQSGWYKAPRLKPAADCVECRIFPPELDQRAFLKDLMQSPELKALGIGLGSYGSGSQECVSKTRTVDRQKNLLMDLESCPQALASVFKEVVSQTQTSQICITDQAPTLGPKMRGFVPLWSCTTETDPEFGYEKKLCASRLKNPGDTQALDRCVAYFKDTRRIVVFHPVFPERVFVRLAPNASVPLGDVDALSNSLLRYWISRAGFSEEDPVTRGCLGVCGMTPGSYKNWTAQGCEACFSGLSKPSEPRPMCRFESPPPEVIAPLASLHDFEECQLAVDLGDSTGIPRACARIESLDVFKKVCDKKNAAQCLKSSGLKSRLGAEMRALTKDRRRLMEQFVGFRFSAATRLERCLRALWDIQQSIKKETKSYAMNREQLFGRMDMVAPPGAYCRRVDLQLVQGGSAEEFWITARYNQTQMFIDENARLSLGEPKPRAPSDLSPSVVKPRKY